MRSGWQLDLMGEVVYVAAEVVTEVAAKMGWRVERRADGSVVAVAEAEVAGPVSVEDGFEVVAA